MGTYLAEKRLCVSHSYGVLDRSCVRERTVPNHRKIPAFTLIELLVVIAIIATLLGILVS